MPPFLPLTPLVLRSSCMALLDRYVPQYPTPGAMLAGQILGREARPRGFPREVFEDIGKKTIRGLRLLVAEAWDTGIDFEKAIYELAGQERLIREIDRAVRLQAAGARRAVKVAKKLNMEQEDLDRAREAVEEGEWLCGVNRPVIAEYQKSRRRLEEIRDARLQEFAAEWELYLSQLDLPFAEDVRKAWSYLRQRLWAPEAAPTEEGFRMVWDRGPHHLQIEVFPGGRYDWFYRNRDTEGLQSEENLALGSYPVVLRELLQRISAA
jgi:hypothetical protein